MKGPASIEAERQKDIGHRIAHHSRAPGAEGRLHAAVSLGEQHREGERDHRAHGTPRRGESLQRGTGIAHHRGVDALELMPKGPDRSGVRE